MRKRYLRIISAVLSFVMVFSMLPFGAITVVAADKGNSNIELLSNGFPVYNLLNIEDGVHNLGQGYQAIVNLDFLENKYLANCISGSATTYSFTYINDLSTYIENEKFKAGASANWNQRFPLLEMDLKAKFQMEKISSNSSSTSNEKVSMSVKAARFQMTLNLESINQLKALWSTDDDGDFMALNPYFVQSLLTDSPEVFYKNYGTHLVTRYNAGGEAFASYEGNNIASSNSSSFSWDANITAKFTSPFTTQVEIDANAGGADDSTSTSSKGYKKTNANVYGGNGDFDIDSLLAGNAGSHSSWLNSLDNREKLEILTDDSLKLLPVWELLYQDEYEDRRTELEEYFNENVNEDYAEFYSDYIYNPIGTVDYSGYTFIKSTEDFANIAKDLDGKYVLLNNIDLGGIEWSPVGTADKPFTGTLDGNGNTVSGLNITKTTDGVAGLFGYNNGTIRNLTVSGRINADATGSENNIAYIGGIAGYNGGTIYNSYNLVSVNGSIIITDKDNDADYLVNETWFDTHKHDIKNAKSVPATTINETIYTVPSDTTVLKLTGIYDNLSINIPGSTQPMYIVLENTNITGVIGNIGDNSREVCIISIGESNSITGVAETSPINIPNASLFIFGNAKLNIDGYDGQKGADGKNGADRPGRASNGNNGVTGGSGTNGSAGENGTQAMIAKNIYVDLYTDMVINGGSGGNGGNGGNGGYGQAGGSTLYSLWDTSTWGNPGNGAGGGNGGDGGDGGEAAVGIETESFTLYNGTCYVYGGDSGSSGSGGRGGNGGAGGDTSASAKDGANGGGGGNGGSSGKVTIAAQAFSDSALIDIAEGAMLFSKRGETGTVGEAGLAGTGGAGGEASGTADDDGHPGGSGTPGAMGPIETFSDHKIAYAQTSTNKYTLISAQLTYEDAKQGMTEKEKLVSIGSIDEQKIVEELISAARVDTSDFWIGLSRRCDSGIGFDIYDWEDGSAVQVIGTGNEAIVNRIDDDGDIICKAYSNFAVGEPNNAYDGEKYIHISIGGCWNDNSAIAMMGYITETKIGSGYTNTIDKNAVFAGGLSGYNAGTIKNSLNDAKVSIYKAEAENSGISTYAGGISGYNNGEIAMVVNKGAIESFAISGSMSHYADAYAETISTTSANGKVNNYTGINDLSAIAISVNTLRGEYISSSVSAGTDATTTVEDYWKNSELIINSVNKTDYLVSQGFDESSLNLSYNGSPVTSYNVRYNFYQPRTSTVTVVYENGSNSFERYIPIKVNAASPISIELYGAPKVEFICGDDFTYKGLSVKLNYNNDTYKLIPSKNVTISEPNMSLIGEQLISVSYTPDGGVTYLSFDYVINISAVAMTSLQIVKTPDKITYWKDETLDTTGLLVEKVMNNGTTEEISIGNAALTIDYDFTSIGTQTVTLSYNDFSATFDCIVKAVEVTGINIISEPNKTTYVEGATLNTDGLKVQTTLSNGEVGIITANDVNLSFVYDFSKAGTKTVTVKYGNYADSFTCEVYTYEDYLKTVPNITVESVKGCAGNTITVDLIINNNTGILAAALNINYDSALTLVDAQVGEALSSLTLTKPGSFANPCTFAWDGINDADATNGTILTLTFVISEEAVVGETYEISVSYVEGNIIDGSFENVELATVSGGVTVIDYVPGDLSGDGIVNMADVVNLRRYIVGGYDLNINVDAADVNNDGTVNMADVVLIRRYVVGGYDVELQ